jgi:hypothetical protein
MVVADWLEASTLFHESPVSMNNAVDLLQEQQIYNDQDFCVQFLEDAWSEIRLRQECSPSSGVTATGDTLRRTTEWTAVPAQSFCLVLSLLPRYKDSAGRQTAAERFGSDYTEQGELFELLTRASLLAQWPDWSVDVTGWSRTTAEKLPSVVANVCALLGEDPGRLEKWAPAKSNEAGLDMVLWRDYPDARPGPRYFLQAGSGDGWSAKLKTPDVALWSKFVDFTVAPYLALSIPFALESAEFARRSVSAEGLLLDRHRILACPEPEEVWIDPALLGRLVAWLQPRVDWLVDGAIPLLESW